MTADLDTFGFPPGYFVIRSLATGRLLDIEQDAVEDGTELILWPEKDSCLVESLRIPASNNQVFFIDTSGALCSRSSGHAIDVDGDRLVIRHRRPVSLPFPNAYSHRLPIFSYTKETGEISVRFASDPSYPRPGASRRDSNSWMTKFNVLSSIPTHKPPTFIDNASAFISSAISSPLSLFMPGDNAPNATPDDVFNSGDIDLKEDEVLEEDRGEEGEVDDSPEPMRRVRVLTVTDKTKDERALGEKARLRRRWEVLSIRKTNKKTIG